MLEAAATWGCPPWVLDPRYGPAWWMRRWLLQRQYAKTLGLDPPTLRDMAALHGAELHTD